MIDYFVGTVKKKTLKIARANPKGPVDRTGLICSAICREQLRLRRSVMPRRGTLKVKARKSSKTCKSEYYFCGPRGIALGTATYDGNILFCGNFGEMRFPGPPNAEEQQEPGGKPRIFRKLGHIETINIWDGEAVEFPGLISRERFRSEKLGFLQREIRFLPQHHRCVIRRRNIPD